MGSCGATGAASVSRRLPGAWQRSRLPPRRRRKLYALSRRGATRGGFRERRARHERRGSARVGGRVDSAGPSVRRCHAARASRGGRRARGRPLRPDAAPADMRRHLGACSGRSAGHVAPRARCPCRGHRRGSRARGARRHGGCVCSLSGAHRDPGAALARGGVRRRRPRFRGSVTNRPNCGLARLRFD